MNKELLFSSKKMDWSTPQWLFDLLDREFHFDIDVCADAEDHKCRTYLSIEDDALKTDWGDFLSEDNPVCWMNPPYGRDIGKWIRKAQEESRKGCTVVCLVPARTDTQWWWDYCTGAYEIRFLKGRLVFGSDAYWEWLWDQEFVDDGKGGRKKNPYYHQYGRKDSAGFPSAIVIFLDQSRRDIWDPPMVETPIIKWVDYKEVLDAKKV